MRSVCGFRPGRGCAFHAGIGIRPLASGSALVIHRLIWSDLLYFPGPTVGHMYIPELLCLCFYSEVVRAGVWLELPLCPGHVVVGQPRYVLTVRGPVPRR